MCQNKWDADILWKELNANKRRTPLHWCRYAEKEKTQGSRNILWLIAIHPPKKGWMRPNSLTVHTLNSSISMICQGSLYLRYGWLFPPHPSAVITSLHFFSLYADRKEDVQLWNVASAFLLKQIGANIDFVSPHPSMSGRLTCALINCMRHHLYRSLEIHHPVLFCFFYQSFNLRRGYSSTWARWIIPMLPSPILMKAWEQ